MSIFRSADGSFNFFWNHLMWFLHLRSKLLRALFECTHAPRRNCFCSSLFLFTRMEIEREQSASAGFTASFAPLCRLGDEKIRRGSRYPHFSGFKLSRRFKKKN